MDDVLRTSTAQRSVGRYDSCLRLPANDSDHRMVPRWQTVHGRWYVELCWRCLGKAVDGHRHVVRNQKRGVAATCRIGIAHWMAGLGPHAAFAIGFGLFIGFGPATPALRCVFANKVPPPHSCTNQIRQSKQTNRSIRQESNHTFLSPVVTPVFSGRNMT